MASGDAGAIISMLEEIKRDLRRMKSEIDDIKRDVRYIRTYTK